MRQGKPHILQSWIYLTTLLARVLSIKAYVIKLEASAFERFQMNMWSLGLQLIDTVFPTET